MGTDSTVPPINWRQAWLAALASLISLAANSREPDVGELRSFDFPGYTLLAPDASTAGRVASLLGQGDRILAHLLGHESRAPGIPTTVLVLSQPDLDRYFGGKHAFANAPYQSFSNTILVPAETDPDYLRGAVLHQAAHSFLRTQFAAEIPVWFDEGLALFMAPAEIAGSKVVIGQRRFGSGDVYRDLMDDFGEAANFRRPRVGKDWISTAELLAAQADSRFLATGPASYSLRRQSWLLVHKAFIDDSQFRQGMFSYLAAVNSFVPVDAAVRQSFGMSVADLDRTLSVYSGRENLSEHIIEIPLPGPVRPGEGSPVPAAVMLERMTNLALDSGAKLKNVDELISAAARHGLDAPRVRLLKLRLAAQLREDDALELLLAGLEENLGNPAAARGAALALFERESGNEGRNSQSRALQKQRLARAQDLFGQVLAAQPADAHAAWIYGVTAIRLSRNLDEAVGHLERARQVQPENPDVAAALATIHFMRSEDESMIARLEDTLKFSKSPEQRRWAARQIATARSGTTPPAGK